jgi:hypothetical protein
MPLIDRQLVVDGTPVSRALFGDDKIILALVEVRRIAARITELSAITKRARFDDDPPDGQTLRDAVREIHGLSEQLRNLSEDLRLYTQIQPDR